MEAITPRIFWQESIYLSANVQMEEWPLIEKEMVASDLSMTGMTTYIFRVKEWKGSPLEYFGRSKSTDLPTYLSMEEWLLIEEQLLLIYGGDDHLSCLSKGIEGVPFE